MSTEELATDPPAEAAAAGHGALPRPVMRAAEVGLLVMLPPLLGLWLRPEDPLFAAGGFHWLALPPLLLGLRRGSLVGSLTAIGYVLLLYLGHRLHIPSLEPFPYEYAVELVVFGLVPGEFSDLWNRRLRNLARRGRYLDTRLRLFARAHHLLALSHEALEQRLLGECQSLRDALLQLGQQVSQGSTGVTLYTIAEPLVQLFAGFGWLHRAALYEVKPGGDLAPAPLACLGAPPAGSPVGDPVVRRALSSRALAALDEELAPQGAPLGAAASDAGARVAVPLVDLSGRVYGVLAVTELAFSAFTDRYLTMLALLGGHIGDLLARATADLPEEFHRRLARCVDDARRYRVPSALIGLVIDRERAPVGLAEEMLRFRRSLDLAWGVKSSAGDPVVLLLLPLVDDEGVAGFRRRLESRLHEFGGPAAAGVSIHPRILDAAASRAEILPGLLRECGVAA